MLIFHENMSEEASAVAKVLKSVFGLDSTIGSIDLEGVLRTIPEFNGYMVSYPEIMPLVEKLSPAKGIEAGKFFLILTSRDLYSESNNQEDDWVFGYNLGEVSVISGARLRREDSKPSKVLCVKKELYLNRLKFLAVHEIGHDLVGRDHMKLATWINASTGYKLQLGLHCTNNSCVMYEIIDIKSPKPAKGYMQLGAEERYDAGLDEVLQRLNPDYLCGNCKKSIITNISSS